jgi:hypothetical protein
MSRRVGVWLAIIAVLASSCASGTPWSARSRTSAKPTPTAPSTPVDPLAGTPAAKWGLADAVFDQGIPTRPPKGYTTVTLARARIFATEWLRAGNSDKKLLATGNYTRFKRLNWQSARQTYKVTSQYLSSVKHPLWKWYFVSRFDSSMKVLGHPRARGRWSIDVSRSGSARSLHLTWAGTVAYRVQRGERKYVMAIYREVQWWWKEGASEPGDYTALLDLVGVDNCNFVNGRLVPKAAAQKLAIAQLAHPYANIHKTDPYSKC